MVQRTFYGIDTWDPSLDDLARVYFNEFNRDSLNILISYWYHPPDY